MAEKFTEVANLVRNWSITPVDSENLTLYALYKQATSGDINIPEPSDFILKAKWMAWNERKGVSQEQAKKQYVELAQKLHAKYA